MKNIDEMNEFYTLLQLSNECETNDHEYQQILATGTQQQKKRNIRQCKTLQLPRKSKLPIEWKMFSKMYYIQSYGDRDNTKELSKLDKTH